VPLDLPRGSLAERRAWNGRHPWLVGVYFFVVFAAPVGVLGWVLGDPAFAIFMTAMSAIAGLCAVRAVKTDWRASPRVRRLLNILTAGWLNRVDPPD
jgi:hypothetical protein